MNRRNFIAGIFLLTNAALITRITMGGEMANAGMKNTQNTKESGFAVQLSAEEWKEKLSEEEFRILRKSGTEAAFSSPLNDEKREGIYICAGCESPVYSSEHKFDSGTGWPSFYKPISPDAIGTKKDYKLIWPRTEVHCATCGGHQGHVFEDGPDPTGLRYCINGAALDFDPKEI